MTAAKRKVPAKGKAASTTSTGALDVGDTASDQLRRLLLALPRLSDGEEHALATLARAVGTTAEVLAKDLQTLATRVHDEPGGFIEGLRLSFGKETVWLQSDLFKRPMGLTRPELHALEVGLAILSVERPPDEQAVIESARHHLRNAISGERRRDARVLAEEARAAARKGRTPVTTEVQQYAADLGARASAVVLRVLEQALRTSRAVRIAYRKPTAESAPERTMHPYRLVYLRGAWYVAGYCETAQAVRVFRVDRIEHAVVTPVSYSEPATFSLAALMQDDRMFAAEDPGYLVIKYGAGIARWIREREKGENGPDGSLIVRHPMGDLDWAVRYVLQYGAEAEVLEPGSVRSALVATLEGMRG